MNSKNLFLNGLKIKISFNEKTLTRNLISECKKSFSQILQFKQYNIVNRSKENVMIILDSINDRCKL